MNTGFQAFIIISTIIIILILIWVAAIITDFDTLKLEELDLQRKQAKIAEQQHIDNLYSLYQQNMSTCKSEALKQKKDETYIKDNCTDPINESIIAEWLEEWGHENLLEK